MPLRMDVRMAALPQVGVHRTVYAEIAVATAQHLDGPAF